MPDASENNRESRERIYLDYAGATPVLPEAIEAMMSSMPLCANPGAIHADGVAAKRSLARSRESIAAVLGCKAREIVFVSGGTEANNLSILGFARAVILGKVLVPGQSFSAPQHTAHPLAGTHWIVSSIEHPSVLECFGEIERLGGTVSFVDPDEKGIIRPEAVGVLLRRESVFISVGWGNSEIGVLQPLSRIAGAVRAFEKTHGTTIIFHSDAGQAPLYDASNVHSLGVDLLSLDSGKLYGPRGIGCVYLSDRASLSRIQLGGGQERGLRAGTENVALAAGFAAALSSVAHERRVQSKGIAALRDRFIREVTASLDTVIVNGDPERTMPHIINISVPEIDSEYVVLALDHAGISISTKSACREGEAQESHVVRELGGEPWRARNTLRFSLGRRTSDDQISIAVNELVGIIRAFPKRS